jgi:hypothetical protein
MEFKLLQNSVKFGRKTLTALTPWMFTNVLNDQINQPELAQLAHQAFAVDKYRVETCCIVGKFLNIVLVVYFTIYFLF